MTENKYRTFETRGLVHRSRYPEEVGAIAYEPLCTVGHDGYPDHTDDFVWRDEKSRASWSRGRTAYGHWKILGPDEPEDAEVTCLQCLFFAR